jgi:putative FmdB family regulatory protein
MPMYEYTCTDCAHTFETLVLGQEQPECPQCASRHLQRLMSIPSVGRANTPTTSCPPDGSPCGRMGCNRL